MSDNTEEDKSPLEIVWSKPQPSNTWSDTDVKIPVNTAIRVASAHSADPTVWVDIRFIKSRTYIFPEYDSFIRIEFPQAEKITETGHFVIDSANAIWFVPDTWIAMRNELLEELHLEFDNNG